MQLLREATPQETGEQEHSAVPRQAVGPIEGIIAPKDSRAAMKLTKLFYRSMVETGSAIHMIVGSDGIIKFVSSNYAAHFGWTPEERVGKFCGTLVHPDDHASVAAAFRQVMFDGKKSLTIRYRILCKDGSYKAVEVTGESHFNDGVIDGILLNYRDIDAEVRAEALYRAALDTAEDGFFILDSSGKILEVNEPYCQMHGYTREEMLSMSISDVSMLSPEAIQEQIIKVSTEGKNRVTVTHRRKDGSELALEISCSIIQGYEDRHCGFARDLSERNAFVRKIQHDSLFDRLTDLGNRSFAEKDLAKMDAGGVLPFTVLVGDINGMRLINEIFGDETGDRIIVEMANLLRRCCPGNASLARMSGDEFMAVLPCVDEHAAAAIADKITHACSLCLLEIDSGMYSPSLSLGFATKELKDMPVSRTVKAAYTMMSKNKLLDQKSSHSSLVSLISATLRESSYETKQHADRLVRITKCIARAMGLPISLGGDLELLSALHDIGKIGVDRNILEAPRELTREEWEEIKKHPEIGYRITMASPDLRHIASCILSHHERWDGSGYPYGLAGKAIPLLARILAVADAFDAMVNDRPYRKAMKHSKAVHEIKGCASKQFDPEVVEAFLMCFSQWEDAD